jgi:hypothetical protein
MIVLVITRKARQTEHVAGKEERNNEGKCIYILGGGNIYPYIGRSLPIFTLRRSCGFSVILNYSFSDDGLKRRTKLVSTVNC